MKKIIFLAMAILVVFAVLGCAAITKQEVAANTDSSSGNYQYSASRTWDESETGGANPLTRC